MIDKALLLIQSELNNYLSSHDLSSSTEVTVDNIAMLETSSGDNLTGKIVISVVNVEEESTLKNQRSRLRNPPTGTIYLNRSKPGNVRFDAPIQPLADLPFLFWGPSFKPMDWNGDGDEDFLISSEFFMFYAEKSFLLHGYRRASLISALQEREQLRHRLV